MVKPKYAFEGTEEYRRADEKRRAMKEMLEMLHALENAYFFHLKKWSDEYAEGKRICQAIRSLIEKHGGEDD